MRYFSYFLGLLLWTSQLYAQNKIFSVGPTIGVDHFLSGPIPLTNFNNVDGSTTKYNPGYLYGLEVNYANKRILLNARLLTTRRVYEVSGPYYYNPSLLVRVAVKAHYYSFPLMISYKLKTIQQFGIYAGVGLAPEWISGQFTSTSYDILGSGVAFSLNPQKPNNSFQMGGSLQIVGRYAVNQRLILQLQPMVHYFRKMDTPFAKTDNSSLSISLSLSYTLNKVKSQLYF